MTAGDCSGRAGTVPLDDRQTASSMVIVSAVGVALALLALLVLRAVPVTVSWDPRMKSECAENAASLAG